MGIPEGEKPGVSTATTENMCACKVLEMYEMCVEYLSFVLL
jgi:hypothetical protein